jgi:hypothetical protein
MRRAHINDSQRKRALLFLTTVFATDAVNVVAMLYPYECCPYAGLRIDVICFDRGDFRKLYNPLDWSNWG